MSNSLDAYGESSNPLDDAQVWYDELSKQWPAIAAALLGNEHTRNGGPLRPAFTLMIKAKGTGLQGMLSSQEASKTWFSQVFEAKQPLDAIELQLQEKLGEWIPKSKDRGGRGR
jgi:hypothetical protein